LFPAMRPKGGGGWGGGGGGGQERARNGSLYFEELLFARVREFNPKYRETAGALLGQFRHIHADIYGNREFVGILRNRGKFFCAEARRELDLIVIDYDDPSRNVYEVTEEFYWHNGHYGNREDVVFLVNGIPVVVVECKNASKDEAIALAVDQIRRYHDETPEFFVPQQVFTATEAIGFSYGVTWNLIRRNIFNWKSSQIGRLEEKVKGFFATPHILAFLRDYIIFAEKEEELQKYIMAQHQTEAVGRIVERARDPKKTRGLIWHTQGSGKTFTMIKAAELLFKAPQSDKPTILIMIDRNELEDQMLKNLASLGIGNVEQADSIPGLAALLRSDYRGIIVTTIHKFRDMPANINKRANIYVLVDEAHRTTGGDLGNYLMAGLPNATYIGFTGTPIDRTAYGRGTFKTFGMEDDRGYLHKYSISESIEDGTTLPLFYNLAPNEMLVPHDVLEKEFLALAEAQGVSDIEELNRILERAVKLKNFLKGEKRIDMVARYVADHYRENVEPLGYKAFLVGVDREACALYKKALDGHLPAEYSEVVFTGNNNDSPLLKEFHLDPKKERQIRKDFTRFGQFPKILIVTEKLLTGYDAPILYAMYLDKPMRDHTLLQAIARVNRPYENEKEEMVKPHGFVLDFVGIFEKLEKALAFDSDEIEAVIKDIDLLKTLFQAKMQEKVPQYINLIHHGFDDRDVDNLIESFREKDRRKEFFKEYKEIQMLYEIISPDKFLRPFLEDYATLSAIYEVVRRAYAKTVYVDRLFQKKTNELVRKQIGSLPIPEVTEFVEIDEKTIDLIRKKKGGDTTKIINLVKSIEKAAEEESDDPYLIAMAERARAVQEGFEDRQKNTAECLAELAKEIEKNEERKKEQAAKGLDGLTYFVYRTLLDAGLEEAEETSRKVREAFTEYPHWRQSEKELRELRKMMTFAVYAQEEDLEKAVHIVDTIIRLLEKASRI